MCGLSMRPSEGEEDIEHVDDDCRTDDGASASASGGQDRSMRHERSNVPHFGQCRLFLRRL